MITWALFKTFKLNILIKKHLMKFSIHPDLSIHIIKPESKFNMLKESCQNLEQILYLMSKYEREPPDQHAQRQPAWLRSSEWPFLTMR